MRTYGELFRTKEFTPLFAASSLQVAASTVSGLALGTLVYTATRSPLLSALSMFGTSFAQLAGAMALLSAADRLPPRAAMTAVGLVFIWFSMTPSLLPRGPLFQGLVSGLAGAIGYSIGVFAVWLVRFMLSRDSSPPAPRRAWLALIVVGAIGMVAVGALAAWYRGKGRVVVPRSQTAALPVVAGPDTG